jgi:hypothetical protein
MSFSIFDTIRFGQKSKKEKGKFVTVKSEKFAKK